MAKQPKDPKPKRYRGSPRGHVHTCNGHTLTVSIVCGLRYLHCPRWPDLAAKYDGCADASEAITEFEQRAREAGA